MISNNLYVFPKYYIRKVTYYITFLNIKKTANNTFS